MSEERRSESESPPPRASVQIQGRDSGPPIITVTAHAATVDEAARLAREQYDALVQQYAPPPNGTHGPVAAAASAMPVPVPEAARSDAAPAAEEAVPGHASHAQAPRAPRPMPRVQVQVPRVDVAGAVTRLRSRVDRAVLILCLGGALLSWLAWLAIYRHGNQPLVWDAHQYYVMALQINETGPGDWANPMRTYAFPFFLAAFVAVMGDNAVRVQQAVAFTEWLAILGVAGATGWTIFRLTGARWHGLLAAGLIAFNPILLIQTTALLSDSLSATMIMFAVIPLVAGWQRGLRAATVGWLAAASFFCASLAAEVRPANAIVIPVLGLLWLVRAVWFRSYPWRWAPLILIGLVLPLLPQMVSNQRGFGTLYPLTVSSSLYQESLQYGMTLIKARTSVVPNRPAQLYHDNPFYVPTARMPSELVAQAPLAYLATLFIHGFALVDLDLPYTYVFDYTPWYRWPLSVLGYLFWLLAVVGTSSAVTRSMRQRTIEPTTWAVLAPAVVGLAYLAVYLPVAPDIRYGLPLYLLAVPGVCVGLERVYGSMRQGRGRAVAWGAAAAIVVAACASLSAWIMQQAPLLRE